VKVVQVKPNRKYKFDHLQIKFQAFHLLKDYYSGLVWEDPEAYNVLCQSLDDENYFQETEILKEGLELLSKIEPEVIYDFNRLFVGPGKLLAPPYESYYRNYEKLLMQKETMAVREFYSSAGISVNRFNNEPDDFIALEFEFICYLLYKAAALLVDDPNQSDYYLELYEEFLDRHLGKWVLNHCKDILEHSSTELCRGMAVLTKRLIENEIKKSA